MNKSLLSGLSIFAVAFALVLGFGAINYTKANDLIADSYPGQVNLFGDDQAQNVIVNIYADRDAAKRIVLDSYGLQGGWVSKF